MYLWQSTQVQKPKPMDIFNIIPSHVSQKNFVLTHHKVLQSSLFVLLFLPFICTLASHSTHATNHTGTMTFVIAQQTKPGTAIEQSSDTAQSKKQDHNSNSSTSEIESVLARKAQSGSRKAEMENDRFYTILFYSLSIGTIALIIALFYFFINLNDKGKHLKMLKKRLEKLSLRKARSAV